MADNQPEALRLADRLDLWGDQGDLLEAAAELRRLSAVEAERDALRAALEIAVRQNEHDMVMTGEELRQCRAAIDAVKGGGNG